MVSRSFMQKHKKTAKAIMVLFIVGLFLLVASLVTALVQGELFAIVIFVVLTLLCFWAFVVLVRDYLKMIK